MTTLLFCQSYFLGQIKSGQGLFLICQKDDIVWVYPELASETRGNEREQDTPTRRHSFDGTELLLDQA